MTGLTRLRAAIAPMPSGSLVPVDWVRGLLDETPDDADPTVEDVAEVLGRAPSTIRGWCRAGRLTGAYRLRGREWRIPRAALRSLREGGPVHGGHPEKSSWDRWQRHLDERTGAGR